MVLGDYGEVGSFRKGREENPLKKKKERTDRRKSLLLVLSGGKERSRKCRQVFEGEGREEEVKEVKSTTMDGELWAARMANSKRHHHNFQPSHSSAHLGV